MTLEEFLGNRYRVTTRLPAFNATHQRYVVQGTDGMQEQAILSYCDYAKPLSADALEKQKRVVEVMTRPPVALLCRVTDSRLDRDFQWVVSEFPGDRSLRELLQQRQALNMEEVEAFLRLLTEACEVAVGLGWPRIQLDTAHLFLDARMGLPRIPAPDIPLFENAGSDRPEQDPMATMQFNVADLRAAAEPLPTDTRDYVLPLAALCCDLLGQPQTMRGGNARYQPVPQLTSQQNVLLRRALTSEGRAGFTSAKAFMDDFFGIAMTQSIAAQTERLRSLTATMNRTSSFTRTATHDQPVSMSDVTVRRPMPPPLPGAKKNGAPAVAPLAVRGDDREAAEKLPPTLRLRLVPDNDEAPIFALIADEWLTLGRSAGDADFIAQFRPRSNINDGRSRRISRDQARLQLKDTKIAIEESSAVNPSLVYEGPIPGYVEMDLPASFLLAGEYPVEVRAMPSDYDNPREISGLNHEDKERLHGALIIRAGGSGVLLCEAAMVFSDLGVHFSKSGRPWFRAEGGTTPVARIHRMAGQFWLEPIESSVIAVAKGNEVRTKAHELILLEAGSKLRIGPYGYAVQSYALGTGEK